MALFELIANFLDNPYPLWNNELTQQLVANKLKETEVSYSLTSCILKNAAVQEKIMPLLPGSIKVVMPSTELQLFYEDHGLEPLPKNDSFNFSIVQLQQAMGIFNHLPAIRSFITSIVYSIQLLKAEDSNTDISYSHPDIPFSIFISVCEKISFISNLRMAESILHESMHLLLTLIEGVMPLVNNDSQAVYYSPWREEERQVRGVLHGMFVFKAVSNFYTLLAANINNEIAGEFLSKRQDQISNELSALKNFHHSPGLTENGKQLVVRLIQ